MLRTMRNDFKKYSWTLWIVIIAFLIGFSFTDAFRGGPVSKTDLLSIDGTSLSGADYEKQLLQKIKYIQDQYKSNFSKALINQLRLPEALLNEIINSTIIQKEAKKMNLTASNDELADKILNMFQRNGKFMGKEAYLNLLAYNKIDVKEYEENLKKEIVADKYRNLISAALSIDNAFLKAQYKKDKDKADIQFISLDPKSIKESFTADDNETKKYFEDHKENFKTPEKRAGYVIALLYNDSKDELEITDKELYTYFQDNKQNFKKPGKTKVSRIFLVYNEKNREEILKKAEALKNELKKENFSQKAKENGCPPPYQEGEVITKSIEEIRERVTKQWDSFTKDLDPKRKG
jgi:peptidyl-prolyl cis-trans isomerase D